MDSTIDKFAKSEKLTGKTNNRSQEKLLFETQETALAKVKVSGLNQTREAPGIRC